MIALAKLRNAQARTEASWIACALSLVLGVLFISTVAIPETFLDTHEKALNIAGIATFFTALAVNMLALLTAVTGQRGKRVWPTVCSAVALAFLLALLLSMGGAA